MSFSLDAMIIIPLSLSLFFGGTGLYLDEAKITADSTALIAQVVPREINPPHIYKLEAYKFKGHSLPILKASPQKMVEGISLGHDLFEIVSDRGRANE